MQIYYKNTGIYFLLHLLIAASALTSCRKPELPDNGSETVYGPCFQKGSSSTIEIVTLNVEQFPKEGYQTIVETAALIEAIQPDVIALQEIGSESDFAKLENLLDDYSGIYYPIDNSYWNLAYLYNKKEISIDQAKTKIIFEDDFWSFPRPPFEIHVQHIASSGSLVIINNHLKCCGGAENEERRRSASNKLYNYINTEYPENPVIILGDLNDEISGTREDDNVFWDFVSDTENFRVADMHIARGSSLWWSYPSYPSHIDHIIISNELFTKTDTTMVLKADACYSLYPDIISDHRPVCLSLKPE